MDEMTAATVHSGDAQWNADRGGHAFFFPTTDAASLTFTKCLWCYLVALKRILLKRTLLSCSCSVGMANVAVFSSGTPSFSCCITLKRSDFVLPSPWEHHCVCCICTLGLQLLWYVEACWLHRVRRCCCGAPYSDPNIPGAPLLMKKNVCRVSFLLLVGH